MRAGDWDPRQPVALPASAESANFVSACFQKAGLITRKQHSASATTWRWQGMVMILKDHSSDRCATIAQALRHADPCILM